eukprot:scaffold79563_cov21-Tisochrysis_lutea.AAC.3
MNLYLDAGPPQPQGFGLFKSRCASPKFLLGKGYAEAQVPYQMCITAHNHNRFLPCAVTACT